MNEILRIASGVGTPLALGGLVAALFFFVVLRILTPTFLPQLSQRHGARLIRQIVTGFFVLSLVAMVFGFTGWIVSMVLETHISQKPVTPSAPLVVVSPETRSEVTTINGSVSSPTSGVVQVIYPRYGVSEERFEELVSERAVTKVALDRFFRDLGDTNVSPDRLSEKLEVFVKRYKELEARINASPVPTPEESELKKQAIAAVERGDLDTGENIAKKLRPPTNLRVVIP